MSTYRPADPYDPEIELRRAMAMCTVEQLPDGHRADFYGFLGSCCTSEGPSAWTEDMARKCAVANWALTEYKKQTG